MQPLVHVFNEVIVENANGVSQGDRSQSQVEANVVRIFGQHRALAGTSCTHPKFEIFF